MILVKHIFIEFFRERECSNRNLYKFSNNHIFYGKISKKSGPKNKAN